MSGRVIIHATVGAVTIQAQDSGAVSLVSLDLDAKASGTNYLRANVGGTGILLADSNGRGSWPGSIGQFGANGPNSKPAHPSTLGDVISILQSYGMCA